MPYFGNVLLCFVCTALLIGEIWMILRRNRKIVVRGKDDIIVPAAVMLALVLLMPLDTSLSTLSALRNTVAIVTVFASFAIKRGVSEQGVEKIAYTIPWSKIANVHINSHQTTTVVAVFQLDTGGTNRLIFHIVRLRPLLRELQKHLGHDKILLEQSVERDMQKYPRT